MKKFLFLFLFSLTVTVHAYSIDVSTITSEEIRIATVKELQNLDDVPEELLTALKNYHKTKKYSLSLNEFFKSPDSYFKRRIEALLNLQTVIPSDKRYEFLQKQIECKLAYIKALPDMEDSRTTRMELKYRRQAYQGVELCEAYSFELLDPLHRIGPEVKVYIDSWLSTDIPNYFIFLETVEYDPLLNQFSPFENQVKYYTSDEEREAHRLEFINGLCYLNGIPFDTGRSFSLHSEEEGIAIFTIGFDEEVYVNSHIKYRIHHSSEFAGGEVIGAGELKASSGKIFHISNKSGHYSPKHNEIMDALSVLYNKLGTLSGIELEMFQYTKDNQKYFKQTATFNAEDYFETDGVCPAIKATGNWTPLHVAVWNNHINLADSVINEIDVKCKDFQGNTPLHLAVMQERYDWIYPLLKNGASALEQNALGNTPLHLAALYGQDEVVSLFIEEITTIDKVNNYDQTPLHYAAIGGSQSVFISLINSGADINRTDCWGNSLFHFAVAKGNTELLIYLLESDHFDKINLKNNRSATPLHFAAAFGDIMTVKLFLSLGFDPLKADTKGRTALHYAAKFGNEQTTQLFLNMNSDELIHAKNNKQMTALHYASRTLPYTILQQFIARGIRVNTIDKQGKTPLFYAIDGRSSMTLRNLKYLLTHGGHTQIYNYHGQALIHYAATKGAISSVRRILTTSNDLMLKDRNGRTALEIAQSKNYQRLEKYILDHAPQLD